MASDDYVSDYKAKHGTGGSGGGGTGGGSNVGGTFTAPTPTPGPGATPTPSATPRPRKPGIYGYGDKDKAKTRFRRITDDKAGKRVYYRDDDDKDTPIDEGAWKEQYGEFLEEAAKKVSSNMSAGEREQTNKQQRSALRSAYGRG